MNNYKQLFPWHEEQNTSIKSITFDPSFISKMNLGFSLKGMQMPVVKLKNTKAAFTDFLFTPSIEIIISEKLKLLLQNHEKEGFLEFYPIEFRDKNSPPYFLLNIVGLVDAFDWEKSEYVLFDELGPLGNKVIRKIIKMEIDNSKTEGRRIFILKNYIGTLFLHQSLADEMIAFGITGYKEKPLIGHK
jgi:hypothetical protein